MTRPESIKPLPDDYPEPPYNGAKVNLIFDLLQDEGIPLTNAYIAYALGIRNTKGSSATSRVSNACSGLVDAGLATRIKQGTYQIKEEYRRTKDADPHPKHTTPAVAAPKPPASTLPFPEVMKEVSTAATHVGRDLVTQARVAEDEEDQIIEILDALFPHGFSARVLPKIEAWKAATRDLLHSNALSK